MKKHCFAVAVATLLLSVLLLNACGGESGSGGQLFQPKPTETTVPPLTLESIRVENFSDLPNTDPGYDTACYMRYYGIMDVTDGEFLPGGMMTWADGAEVVRRITGEELTQPEQPDAPLTRGELAVMLYGVAQKMGISTQTTLTQLAYPDADQVKEEQISALLWVTETGIFRSFVGQKLLPDTAVSRLQMAQALLGVCSFDPEDTLAAEIYGQIPARATQSLAVENHDAIQAAVDAAAQKYGAEGLQVAVIENGTLTDTYAYGWAIKGSAEMTPDHKLRVASISKVVVGITAQILREKGVVDLDADISQYWDCTVKNPKYPDVPVTIRSLLTHTSSIVNAGDNVSRAYNSVKTKLQGTGFSNAVPGDIGYWAYNNYGFAVLGMTLELAADQIVDEVLGESLYAPMDIDAAFGSGDIKNTDMLATLYRAGGEVARSVENQKEKHSETTPGASGSFFAGGFTASATDLGKLIALLAGDGAYEGVQLLQRESVEIMETRHSDQQVPGGSWQALPMRCWEDLYGREVIYFHTGSAYGVFNCACYDPITGDGVVVLTSGASGAKDDYGIYKVCAAINEVVYDVIK